MHVNPDLHVYLNLAAEIAREAASCIQPELDKRVTADLGREVKIRGDMRLNNMIVKRLREESPYPVLSEEESFSKEKLENKSYRWIVDPLDGSLNFSHGIPFFCISIAFWKGMNPLVGIVYDFSRKEMFAGLIGEGAWLNGKPIKVSCVKKEKDAVVCTGFPVSTDFSKRSLLNFVKGIQLYKKVRLLGSAALSLAYIASGRADVYQENDIAIWDVAAGIAIVIAAGGVVHFRQTKKENRLAVKAANKFLYQLTLTQRKLKSEKGK